MIFALWAVVIMPTYAQFSMWPAVDPVQLASAMDFSVDCLNALYAHSILNTSMRYANAFLGTLPLLVIQTSFAWLAKSIFIIGCKTILLTSVRQLAFSQAVIGWTTFPTPATVKQSRSIVRWCR